MSLNKSAIAVLSQLQDLCLSLTDEEYKRELTQLHKHSLGQHIRHTIEFFICLKSGFESGIIDYDKRKHDQGIESNRTAALEVISEIIDFLSVNHPDRPLDFSVDYSHDGSDKVILTTTYLRELSYNIEHAVHHMALLKIGIKEINPAFSLPHDFGIAVSTLRYKKSLQ